MKRRRQAPVVTLAESIAMDARRTLSALEHEAGEAKRSGVSLPAWWWERFGEHKARVMVAEREVSRAREKSREQDK